MFGSFFEFLNFLSELLLCLLQGVDGGLLLIRSVLGLIELVLRFLHLARSLTDGLGDFGSDLGGFLLSFLGVAFYFFLLLALLLKSFAFFVGHLSGFFKFLSRLPQSISRLFQFFTGFCQFLLSGLGVFSCLLGCLLSLFSRLFKLVCGLFKLRLYLDIACFRSFLDGGNFLGDLFSLLGRNFSSSLHFLGRLL